ncbi:MAG TPA: transketolase, partial [Thermoleophilaceae bacterium]|nr:transketolase [Thermoleophilaceae bacterium]
FSEDVPKRFEAYGWHTLTVSDVNDLDELAAGIQAGIDEDERPTLISVKSIIGWPAPNKQNTQKAHGSPLGEDEVRLTKEAYGWDPDAQFLVPDEALEHVRKCCGRGAEQEKEWNARFSAFRDENPEQAETFEQMLEGRMPEGFDADPPRFEAGEKMATRKASGKAIQWAAKATPHLVGGAADLASSTNTDIEDCGDVQKGSYEGRNLRFGVREHGMGAVVNGLTLHGFRGYGSTFLIFSDYMKGAIRLSALQKLPAIWVFTHDSIGLGEDGPTHQPIEQLAGLRAIPRLNVIRPADANETALGWQFALRQTEAPSAFALSRQDLPILDPSSMPPDAIERGAYVLVDPPSGEPDLILMASGSEVSIVMEACDALQREGLDTRVVSVPCMDTFAEADQSYRDEVLPPSCRARVAVEAASPFGWERWLADGEFIGMETFGESGPYLEVYEHFGITAEAVRKRGKAVVERVAGSRD